jgi:hypothetical protein
MNSNTDEPAVDRLRHNAIIVERTLSNRSPATIIPSRSVSKQFNEEARQLIPRRIDQDECQSRLRERLGASADPEAVVRYYDTSRPPTIRDLNVFAISHNRPTVDHSFRHAGVGSSDCLGRQVDHWLLQRSRPFSLPRGRARLEACTSKHAQAGEAQKERRYERISILPMYYRGTCIWPTW